MTAGSCLDPSSLATTLPSMALYAAYGSNMDAEQMLKRCPHSPTRGNGWLQD